MFKTGWPLIKEIMIKVIQVGTVDCFPAGNCVNANYELQILISYGWWTLDNRSIRYFLNWPINLYFESPINLYFTGIDQAETNINCIECGIVSCAHFYTSQAIMVGKTSILTLQEEFCTLSFRSARNTSCKFYVTYSLNRMRNSKCRYKLTALFMNFEVLELSTIRRWLFSVKRVSLLENCIYFRVIPKTVLYSLRE